MIRLAISITLLVSISGCANVQVTDLTGDEYMIEQTRFEPPTSFESRALTSKAEQLCPKGYSYLLRQAYSDHEFAVHHGECATGADCEFKLQWRIRCGNIPREPFSLFGKT